MIAYQNLTLKHLVIQKNIGIWTDHKGEINKVAAIGVRVSKWIAYHGFAININNDLSKYKNIISMWYFR